MVVWSLPVLMRLNSRFGENHRIIEFLVPNSRTNAARAFAAPAKGHFVRIADIEVRCSEGPVWIILLFKQLFIGVHFYQLCQAEELL